MTPITNFYRSSNGDRWQLVHDEKPVVRHIANPAAGGHTTETSVEEFLGIDGPGPEFAALRRLLDEGAEPSKH